MEYIVAGVILLISIIIITKNIKKKTSGSCDCDSCAKNCTGCSHKKK